MRKCCHRLLAVPVLYCEPMYKEVQVTRTQNRIARAPLAFMHQYLHPHTITHTIVNVHNNTRRKMAHPGMPQPSAGTSSPAAATYNSSVVYQVPYSVLSIPNPSPNTLDGTAHSTSTLESGHARHAASVAWQIDVPSPYSSDDILK